MMIQRIDDMARVAAEALDKMPEVWKELRITISSGEGDNQLRQAVAVARAFRKIDDANPTLDGLFRGINYLKKWAERMYPERTDWIVTAQEHLMHWPRGLEEGSDEDQT
jgi:hypothetical protein